MTVWSSVRKPPKPISLAPEASSARVVARTLVLATAVTGLGEIVLQRLVLPIASHVPGAAGFSAVVARGAEMALGATAFLAVLTAVAVAATATPIVAGSVLAVTASTVAAAAVGSTATEAVAHLATIGAVCAVLVVASRQLPRVLAAAITLIGAGVMAGQWPLLRDAFGAGAMAVGARTVAEVALVTAPLLLAVYVITTASPSRRVWLAAAGGGVAAAAVLATEPQYAAMASLWAVGVTMSLPPVLYIAATAAIALVLTSWLTDESNRPAAAGLILLAVSGIGPAAVHHNLTAVVGLVLVAGPLLMINARTLGPADDSVEV